MSSSDDDEVYDPAAVAVVTRLSSTTSANVQQPLLSTQPQVNTGDYQQQQQQQKPTNTAPDAHTTALHIGLPFSSSHAFPLLHKLRPPHSKTTTISALAVSRGGEMLIVGSGDGSVHMYDFTATRSTAEPTKKENKSNDKATSQSRAAAPPPLTASPQNPFLPTRSMTPFANAFGTNDGITCVKFNATGSHVLLGHEGDTVLCVEAASGRQLDRTAVGSRSILDTVRSPGHKAPVTGVDVSIHVATQFCTGSLDGTIRLWDIRNMKRQSSFAAKHGSSASDTLTHTVPIYSCSMLCDQPKLIASAGADGIVQLWDTTAAYRPGRSAKVLSCCPGVPIGCIVALGTDSSLLAVRYGEGHLGFLDTRMDSKGFLTVCEDVLPYRGDYTNSLVVHHHTDSSVKSLMVGTSGKGFRRTAGGHLVEVSLDSSRLGQVLRAECVDHASETVVVATDEVHDQILVGVGGETQLRNGAMRRMDSSSPMQRWLQEALAGREGGRPGGVAGKRPREENEKPSASSRADVDVYF